MILCFINPLFKKSCLSGWWLYTHPSEKYEFVNWDDELFPR